jgi:amidase
VRNPYDLERDPGASSSGTAAAIASNLALVGLAGDGAGSTRLPASFCNLVGLKPTVGLISGHGCFYGVKGQATLGPMSRTVTDAALMMDAMVGYDEEDLQTAVNAFAIPPVGGSFAAELGKLDIGSTKLGVIRALFGDDQNPEQAAVNSVVNGFLGKLEEAGSSSVGIEIAGLKHYLESTNLFLSRNRGDMDAFLKPVLGIDLAEMYATKKHPPWNVMIPYIVTQGAASQYEFDGYAKQLDLREEFQLAVASSMLKHGVSAFVFPTAKQAAPRHADIDFKMRAYFPTNTGFATQLRWPAISVPIGFTDQGLPVGLEIVGPPFSDAALLKLAYGIEQLVQARRSPGLNQSSSTRNA